MVALSFGIGARLNEFFELFKAFAQKNIIDPLTQIGVVDIVDILLLTFMLYYVYRFIRNRRAGRLAIGMLFIVIVLLLSTFFDMHAMKYILQNFYQVGIIAIIVVFQPELRAALEKVGTTPITGLKNITGETKDKTAINTAADAITNAVFNMSEDKTGALIVIEGTTKLGEYASSGVILNAQVTAALIQNIFYNKAPLHDGAIIIRDMKVHAAACYLPVCPNNDIDIKLGTRHRAAIGLSQVSDATTIVVSEETGTVSVAHEGTLRRNITKTMLKNELMKLLTANMSAQHTKKVKEQDKKNIG